jgi:hypothetical protein
VPSEAALLTHLPPFLPIRLIRMTTKKIKILTRFWFNTAHFWFNMARVALVGLTRQALLAWIAAIPVLTEKC